MYYIEKCVSADVHKTSEDPMHGYSTTGCFVEGSQMIH